MTSRLFAAATLGALWAVGCGGDLPTTDARTDDAARDHTQSPLDVLEDSSNDSAPDAASDVSMLDASEDTARDVTATDSAPLCPVGLLRCGEVCIDPQTSTMHCGACGSVCPLGQMCVAGACAIECLAPRARCTVGGMLACVDPQTSTMHCGACDTMCAAAPNAAAACTAGSCGLGACNAGFADCDANAANGCETDTNTTVSSCGMCGRSCPALPNATTSCTLGVCGLGACNVGFADCDGNPANGCEVNLNTTVSNCGTCGRTCSAANASSVCAMGMCALGACTTGFGNCDGNPVNGCETNLNTTLASCGACGRVCAVANGTPSCTAGTCAVAACTTGFANCDGNAANGCEVNTNTTLASCGACGRVCTVANGTPSCTAGTCVIAGCTAGFGNCDGNAANGCETNTTNTTTHCGACGVVCAAGAACVAGACVASTTVAFPSGGSAVGVTPAGTLSSIGAGPRYFRNGDFITETFSRMAPTTRLDLSFTMIDQTATCAVGQPLTWNVLVNGLVVGTFGWPGGSGLTPRTVTNTYTFAAQPAGNVVLRLQSTTTVCSGGGSWVWQPGTAVLR